MERIFYKVKVKIDKYLMIDTKLLLGIATTIHTRYFEQGILTEGEGLVQLTSLITSSDPLL
jgi:hypothetical protein